jgi:hypothetical protein
LDLCPINTLSLLTLTLSIARLFNAPLDNPQAEALGVSTIGSSEAIILAVLAAKRAWKNKRQAQGKPTDKPNIVMVGIGYLEVLIILKSRRRMLLFKVCHYVRTGIRAH